MSEREVFNWLLWTFFGLGVVTLLVLFFVTAPYGRHARSGWGITLPNLWAWLLMEIPAPLGMAVWFALGGRSDAVSIAFFALWQLHYCQRTFVFPFLMRPGDPPMPLVIAFFGFTFNVFNSYLNGRWLFHFAEPYAASWLVDPRFVLGLATFLAGFAINLHSDHVLRSLRKPGDTSFKVPYGGMFRFVSSANYLGEVLEWVGWAVLTWSWPGALFAFWTFANLGPRAWANHRWYKATFPDYPTDRRALIPFLF